MLAELQGQIERITFTSFFELNLDPKRSRHDSSKLGGLYLNFLEHERAWKVTDTCTGFGEKRTIWRSTANGTAKEPPLAT